MKQFLDWSSYKDAGMGDAYADIPKHGGDWAKAIAACINSRQCEDLGKLLMCPSYKISKNPYLSPGGRVKLLKKALSDDQIDFSDPVLEEAMRLCVSCKGCKRECEANIDMPLIKAEYLAQRRAIQGMRFRDSLFAFTPHWLHYLPGLRLLIQLRNRSAVFAWIGEKLFGINARVPLPVPSRAKLSKLINEAEALLSEPARSKTKVVLLADTFSKHFNPEVLIASKRVLDAAGYDVQINKPEDDSKKPLCCGRTFLAQGMIDRARQEAKRFVSQLLPVAQQDVPIIGLEASCVLGLRDDAQALHLGNDVKTVAKQVLLFEEFIAREIKAGRFKLKLEKPSKKVYVHGHCQQKSMGAMKSMRRVLKSVPDLEFEFIDSSCCGMAGTFGLEAEHEKESFAMANSKLLPAIKNIGDSVLIGNGFSCRQQIASLSDKSAIHLAEYLASLLAD